MLALDFENVCKVFGKTPRAALDAYAAGETREAILERMGCLVAVMEVSLSIEKGEIFVLMGSSGSGKSTLLRCINGLVSVTSGRLTVHHEGGTVDLAGCAPFTLRALRKSGVAMVFQKPALQPWRTIFENTALGLEIHGTPPAEIEARVREKLELVGLGPWASKYPRELSGGMQQRVGLARALATDAEILLLDEPFSALDPLTRVRLQEELLRLQQQLKKTMVFVTHDVQEAMRLGSRIAIMDAGRVLQVGTPEKILFEPASELVREFMAHVNPVSVLSVRACMRPLRALVRVPGAPDAVRLDSAGKYIATLDGRGVLQGVTMSGAPATVISHEQAHAEPAGSQAIVTGPPDLPLSAIMRDLPRRPLPVLDAERRLVGVLMPDDIWRAFTAQPEVNETNLLL